MNRIARYPMWIVALVTLSIGSIAGGAFVGSSAMLAGHAPAAAAAAAAPVSEPAQMPTTFAPVVKSVCSPLLSIFLQPKSCEPLPKMTNLARFAI